MLAACIAKAAIIPQGVAGKWNLRVGVVAGLPPDDQAAGRVFD
jgi:hypothetical protein